MQNFTQQISHKLTQRGNRVWQETWNGDLKLLSCLDGYINEMSCLPGRVYWWPILDKHLSNPVTMCKWFVTDCKLEEQLRTVVNIYCKTSSLPTFPSDSQFTSDAKGNDFCLVVVIFNSQKSTKYIIRVMFSWPFWARAFLSSIGIGNTRSPSFVYKNANSLYYFPYYGNY